MSLSECLGGGCWHELFKNRVILKQMTKTNPIIIFDFDGPINDVSDRYFAVHRDVCDRLGLLCQLTKPEFWALKRHQAPLRVLLECHGESHLDDYACLWLELIEHERYLALDRMQGRAAEVLNRIGKNNQLVLLSLRTNLDAALRQIERYQIDTLFEHVCFLKHQNQPSSAKSEAVRRLYVSQQNIQFFVGDTEIDLMAAKKLNVKFIGVGSGIRSPKKLLELGADFVLPDIAAVEGFIEDENN